jgi:hypothetical protein
LKTNYYTYSLFIILLCFYSINLLAFNKEGDFFSKEKELNLLIDSMIKLRDADEILLLNETFAMELESCLNAPESFNYPFDSLKLITKITAPDKKWRMFNWHIEDSKRQFLHFAILQYKTEGVYKVFRFEDAASELQNPENKILKYTQWYGCHYFKVFMPDKSTYMLLGVNGSDFKLNRKVIEVLSFDNKGNPVLGAAIFKAEKGAPKRIVFEYAKEVSMSLKYFENKKAIVFDHLAPREPHLVNQFQYYGPDLSYDSYLFKGGKWEYEKDVDIKKFSTENKKVKYNNPE